MDSNLLMASFLFGLIGTGFFMYGKKSGQPVPLVAGLLLIGLPYLLPNLIAMIVVCTVLCVLPWLLRTA